MKLGWGTAQICADLGRLPAQIMKIAIFTAEKLIFSWNWVPTAQIGAEGVRELRSWENQFLRPNRNFHEIGCQRPKSAQKPFPSSDFMRKSIFTAVKIDFLMIWAAHGPNRRRFGPWASSDHEKLRFLRPKNCIFSWNLGCPRPKSAQIWRPWAPRFHENCDSAVKIAISHEIWAANGPNLRRFGPFHPQISWEIAIFTAVIAIFMKSECPRTPNLRRSRPRAQIDFHEKINFYGRIAIFMKLGGHGFCADLGRGHPDFMRTLRFGRKNWISHDWAAGRPKSARIWAVGTSISWEIAIFTAVKIAFSHEMSCPRPKCAQIWRPWAQISWEIAIFTAVKIAFSHEIWAGGRLLRRFGPWAS